MSPRPRLLLTLFLWTLGSFGVQSLEAMDRIKIWVAEPGVYSVRIEDLLTASGRRRLDTHRLRLWHRDESVPIWIEDEGDGALGPGDELRFLATSDQLWPARLHETFPLAALVLDFDSPPEEVEVAAPETSGPCPGPLAETPLRRRLHFEEDHLRAPLAGPKRAARAESAWYWALISHQASSTFGLDLGSLADRVADEDLDLTIRIRLLGWSEPDLPEDMLHHRVEVVLNDRVLGEGRWNGREAHEIHLEDLPDQGPLRGSNRLELRIPTRQMPAGDGPVIDLVYVDWVEVSYRVAAPRSDLGEAWMAGPSPCPTLFPAAWSRPGDRLYSANGWAADRDPRGRGWKTPALLEPTPLWLASEKTLRPPVAVEPLVELEPLRKDIDYLMIAPPALAPGVERLAEAHRRRGLDVEVVDARGIYDTYDAGHASAAALRALLLAAERTSPELRFVLLVGDTSWFAPPRGAHAKETIEARSHLLPTWTYYSQVGPAASDHFLAREESNGHSPRFAVGRLPVAGEAELDRTIDKIIRYLEATTPEPSVLLVSDLSPPSLGRARRSLQRLADAGAHLQTLELQEGKPPDSNLIEALDEAPAIVHFNGHGSRHAWQLGDSATLGPELFFDREDLVRAAPVERPPIVVSISCSTAPFDHPSASSLGEAMLLADQRGAIAFVGASSRLYTAPRFGETIVRHLLAGETIGEALVAAKRELSHPAVSHLYNLLGDPALRIVHEP